MSVTRSNVEVVPSGNFCHPASLGPAVALVLNQISCTVMYAWEYCAGTFAVADTLVRVSHAPSARQLAKKSAMRDENAIVEALNIMVNPVFARAFVRTMIPLSPRFNVCSEGRQPCDARHRR